VPTRTRSRRGYGVMKKLFAGMIALAALVGASARAADTPVKTPVPAEPPFTVYSWSGFYIGVQGGGGWSRVVQTDSRPFNSDPYHGTGGVIGGTLGVNMQFDQIVFGLEADGASSWIKDSTIGTNPLFGNCGGATPRCFSNLQALATVRARAGIAMDNVLPYVTGGLAVGSLHGEEGDAAANGAFGAGTTTVVGWTAGVGIEAMFNRNWSAKAEYLYVDFGNRAIFNDNVGGVIVPETLRFTANILRVGLNYRFGY
jgi:outer membrane immunogenic protein